MKPIVKQFDKKAAFTIVELLTVMSIIIILIGMLVPALNQVRRFARKVEQKNQFHTIDVGLDLFHAEWDGYPPSNENDDDDYYCGAMKLSEAMVGQDLLGFHPDSDFTYTTWPNAVYLDKTDLSARRMHLKAESTSAYRVDYLYPNTGPYDPCCLVLCDVYTNVTHELTGKLIGMPILYYRANTAGTTHPTRDNNVGKDETQNIYNYKDNDGLAKLGMQWDPPPSITGEHPLEVDPVENFYYKIWNEEVEIQGGRPYKQDSYILLSAGFDGKYGTGDDVFNF